MTLKTNSPVVGFDSKTTIKIGSLFFTNKFVLLNVNEGQHLGYSEMQEISLVISEYFQDRPFAYICNKATSYSVNPITYKRLNDRENLKCIAVVKKSTKGFDLGVEKHFIEKPFQVFETLEEASNWIDSFI